MNVNILTKLKHLKTKNMVLDKNDFLKVCKEETLHEADHCFVNLWRFGANFIVVLFTFVEVS